VNQVLRNTANVLPDGTNNASGVAQVDDLWAFGQVLSVVMIITNIFPECRKIRPTAERRAEERKESIGQRGIVLLLCISQGGLNPVFSARLLPTE
jgi:hypothetical protein